MSTNNSAGRPDVGAVLTPPLPASPARRAIYRFANASPDDVTTHGDRTRWTRIATSLALLGLYVTVAVFTFLHGLLDHAEVACLTAAVVVAVGIVSFDRGVLGTSNANLDDVEVPTDNEGEERLRDAHFHPMRPLGKAMITGRILVAVLMALVVTEQLTTAVFHRQIARELQQEHAKDTKKFLQGPDGPAALATAQKRRANAPVRSKDGDIRRLEHQVASYDRKAILARQGHDATGQKGCGHQCRGWLSQRDLAQSNLDRARAQRAALKVKADRRIAKINRATAKAEATAQQTIDQDRGGLSDTKALFAFLVHNPEGLIVFVPISLLLFLLDLSALIYKLAGKNSIYELRQSLRSRMIWQHDAWATWAVFGSALSVLRTDIAARVAAAALRQQIKEAVNDPAVRERMELIARDEMLKQYDRRQTVEPMPPSSVERRKDMPRKAVAKAAEPRAPRHFTQRSGADFEIIELVPGAVVAGKHRWRLVRRLPVDRQGGHSVVFVAEDVAGVRGPVAIKFMYLPRAHGHDVGDLVRERAVRELRNVEQLPSNQFIVPIVDQVVEAGEDALWLATPLAEHGSLATFYRDRPKRSVREVILVAGQVAAALNAAYSARRIVHRDVKPGNVLVFSLQQRTGVGPTFAVPRVKVTDWALSRVESMMESALDLSPGGTPWFAAPQARDPKSADPRDDLYGFGCLLWWLITGEPPLFAELGPHAGPDEINAVAQRRSEAPRPWDDLRFWQPEVPVELAAFVRRLLAYDQDRRAPDVSNPFEWAETTLKRMLDGLDADATMTGSEIYVGPACETPAARGEVGAGPEADDEGQPGVAGASYVQAFEASETDDDAFDEFATFDGDLGEDAHDAGDGGGEAGQPGGIDPSNPPTEEEPPASAPGQ